MKLLCTLRPRTDGTIIVRDAKGAPTVFKADDYGALVADVSDQAMVGRLLASGSFEPADEADHGEAERLLKAAASANRDDDQDDDDDDFDGNPDDVPVGALPEEANTPPRATRKPRGKLN